MFWAPEVYGGSSCHCSVIWTEFWIDETTSSLLQQTASKRSRSYWTVDTEAGRLLLSWRTIVVRQSLSKWKAKWFVDCNCVCWFVVVVSSEELSRGTPSTVSSWAVVCLTAVVCVLRRSSLSAVSTQGVVDLVVQLFIVVSRAGLRSSSSSKTPNRRKNHDCVAVIYRLSRSIRHIYNQKKRRRKIHD